MVDEAPEDPRESWPNESEERSGLLDSGGRQGTRMYSARAKMLHPILGVPLVSYPVERALELRASPIVAVLGHQRAEVEKALVARHGQAL